MSSHRFTGWLRRSQLRLLAAIQATGGGLVIFDIVDWTPQQLAAAVLVANTWLAVAAGQSVDVRALNELQAGQ